MTGSLSLIGKKFRLVFILYNQKVLPKAVTQKGGK